MKIVITHHNADLDALASMVAATHLYGATAVGGTIVSPPVKRYLAIHKDHFMITPVSQVDPNDVEEVIIVDVRDSRRLKDYTDLIAAAKRVVIWDHHPETAFDVKGDEQVVTAIGACTTLLVDALLNAGMTIEPTEATLYLLGIYSDTGRLSFSNTRPRDIRTCAQLLEMGANLKVVNRYLHRVNTPEQSELLLAWMNAEEESFDSVEVAFAQAKVPKFVRGASSVVEQVLEFGGHDAVLGIVEFTKSKQVQIIGRSRVSYIDMGALLKRYGGGGHRGAAAAMVRKTTLADVVERLHTDLRGMVMEALRVGDIMSHPVLTIPHDLSLEEASERLDEWGVSGAPVLRDTDPVGVISRRDLERVRLVGNLHLPVSSSMTHGVISIDHHEPIEDALAQMTSQDVGRLFVTKDGDMVGIVTRTDLIETLYMKEPDDSELG